MSSPLPPDPYLALGVAKDATASTIKSQYRKLALKFHPDKVKDESQKQAASDQFHLIQTAYEIIGDEDRRTRYDAQCRLAELRREAMERRDGSVYGSEVRTAAYKMPTDAPRASYFHARGPEKAEKISPVYEERRPTYDSDYFDAKPRASARKDAEYERATKRTTSRDSRDRVRVSAKDTRKSERVIREERNRRTEKDIRRDRDRKQSYPADDTGSDSDRYEQAARKMREEDDLRRAREQYYGTPLKQKSSPEYGYFDDEERLRKIHSQYDEAQSHIGRTRSVRRPESERRPSPVRTSSSRDKLAFFKTSDSKPSLSRRESTRPKLSRQGSEMRRSVLRENGRRTSQDIVDEPRRPPTLNHTRSSPAEIQVPPEKPRAQSVQLESPPAEDSPPKMRRAETMPSSRDHTLRPDARRRESGVPQRGSMLRETRTADGLPTPASTPGWSESAPSSPSKKYNYGQAYADDLEYPTPDGYETKARETSGTPRHSRMYTRSPSPIREREKTERPERPHSIRAASARYSTVPSLRPSSMHRTTSTSYVYNPDKGVESYDRPNLSRQNSVRVEPAYYNASSRPRSSRESSYKQSPPAEVRYQQKVRPEDLRPQTGYGHSRRTSDQRPSYSRSGSYQPVYAR